MSAELREVALELIDDHPQNPRLVFRQDVIDGIVANLNGSYPQKHAVHVRPVGERFQLISGHHRKRAAEAKGYSSVWCWVEELSDDEAYMALATSNNQGELSPLEIGVHALHCVSLSKGGSGKKGGLSAYAEAVGKNQSTLSQYRAAASVAVKVLVDQCLLQEKVQHLYAISSLPEPCLQGCVEHVLRKELSAADTKECVGKVRKFLGSLEVPESPGIDSVGIAERANLFACGGFLDRHKVAVAIFCGRDESGFVRIGSLAAEVRESLADHWDLVAEWDGWLLVGAGRESWDIRQVQEKRLELENKVWERENAAAEPQEEVNLILADPPWRYDFAETDNRQIENHYPSAEPEDIIGHIRAPQMPPIADDCVLFMWATVAKLKEAFQVMEGWGFAYKTHAVWDKQKIGMGYWFRGQHELLLVGTRGAFSPPEPENRVSSVFSEKRGEHSEKPECVYAWIEKAFPTARKLEMYCRSPREGWAVFGNESKEE